MFDSRFAEGGDLALRSGLSGLGLREDFFTSGDCTLSCTGFWTAAGDLDRSLCRFSCEVDRFLRLSAGDLDRSFRLLNAALVDGLFISSRDGERVRCGFTGVLERSFLLDLAGDGERFLRFSAGEIDRFLRLSTGDRSFRELVGDLDRCFLPAGGDFERSRLSSFGGGDRDFFLEDLPAGDARSLRSR